MGANCPIIAPTVQCVRGPIMKGASRTS